MPVWPHDDNASLIAFYGDPSHPHWMAESLLPFSPPWQMSYKGDNGVVSPVSHFMVHKLIGPSMIRIFNAIWLAYGKDHTKIEADGMHWYGGCFAQRTVRGSTSKLSCHNFAAAIDIDPEHEPMNRTHTSKMPQVVVDAFKSEGAGWGGDFISRQDPMHFQFAHE